MADPLVKLAHERWLLELCAKSSDRCVYDCVGFLLALCRETLDGLQDRIELPDVAVTKRLCDRVRICPSLPQALRGIRVFLASLEKCDDQRIGRCELDGHNHDGPEGSHLQCA